MTKQAVTLGDVMALDLDPHRVEAGNTYPNIGIYSFGRGTFGKQAIDAAETSASTLYRIRAGQIIYSRLFAFEGAYASVPAEHDGAFVSNEFPTFTVDTARADPAFIGWLFRWSETWRSLRAGAVGMGDRRQRVHPERVLRHRFALPQLTEQRRLVARLDAAAAAVERANQLISEVDYDLLQAARNIIWQAGEDPKVWVPCGSFLRQRALDVRVEAEIEYAFAGVYSFGRGIFRSEVKGGSTFSYPALTRIRAGDFTYPKLMAWEGALGVVPTECDGLVVSPEFPVFEIDAAIVQPAVVDTFFRDPRTLPMLRSASSGTNVRRRRIQPGQFLGLKMPIPSTAEQAMIMTILERRNAVLEARRDSVAALQALLPAMLNEAFDAAE
ncbi:restriction endonuclease subunit S [Sphingobium sp. LMA1-1-1.1]|uniref:restriction endonuclease subunit S n=1 Tax=Sphingobium sp. LMA1-1-1.1 TaxID=3135238 RepID=UPI0034446A50